MNASHWVCRTSLVLHTLLKILTEVITRVRISLTWFSSANPSLEPGKNSTTKTCILIFFDILLNVRIVRVNE